MRFSPFHSTGANRSGIRNVSTDSKSISGNAIRGIGAAIDKSRVSSSGDIVSFEVGGGTVLQTLDNSPISNHPFEVTFVGKGGSASVPAGNWFRIEEGMFFGRSGQETGSSQVGFPHAFNVKTWTIGSNSTFIQIDDEVEKIEQVSSPETTGLLCNKNQTIFNLPSDSLNYFLIYVECLRDYGAYDGEQWDPVGQSAWTISLKIKPSVEVGTDIDDQQPIFTQDQFSGNAGNYFGYDFGRFVFPIAEIQKNGGDTEDQVIVRQLLRSDIFFFPTLRTQYFTPPAPPPPLPE